MKNIAVEDDLYRYIASHTEDIGEGASAILRRLLGLPIVGEIEVDGPLIPPTDVRSKSLASLRKHTQEVVEQVSAACGVQQAPSTPQTMSPQAKPQSQSQSKSANSASSPAGFSALLEPALLGEQKAAVGRFLYLLSQLHDAHQQDFAKVLEISGRDRVYFATNEQTLLGKNGSTKPKQIGDSAYWVITNSNTGKKRSMLSKALIALGCGQEAAQEIAQQI